MTQLIIAGNYSQFKNYISLYCKNKKCIYIDNIYKLYGRRDYTIYLVGTYRDNPVFKDEKYFTEFCKSCNIDLRFCDY